MENMQYAEEVVREFLIFRGFTSTLQEFESERCTDIGKGFEVDKIQELIFSAYIPKFQADKLVSLFTFFKQCFTSPSDAVIYATLVKLETSILRYYIVSAIQAGRKDAVVDFFASHGSELVQRDRDWTSWFVIPYLKNPISDPQFRTYFSKEWYEALRLSVKNFFSEIFNGTRLPGLLKISSEKITVNHLKKDIKQLNLKLSQLQAMLEEKEIQISSLRSAVDAASTRTSEINDMIPSNTLNEDIPLTTSRVNETAVSELCLDEKEREEEEESIREPSLSLTDSCLSELKDEPSWRECMERKSNNSNHSMKMKYDFNGNNRREMLNESEFPEVRVDFQETFLGHTSPISRCRFSSSGNNIASASIDGTVRIWTYESSLSASKNATIYCGAEICSLDWECKSDRLLLIGTGDGGIKAWNVDAKRVVCDLATEDGFPTVLDLKCSPVESVFVSAAASRRKGFSFIDRLGYASLTVWNMKTWKAVTALPLGEDPPAITSLCFNHNGKILAASATDGMIHMFDMAAGLQITGWPAHDSAISSILFGPDETSIFSLGADGQILEWSLHNQGHVLWSRKCDRFYDIETSKHCHEMALDANGRRLLMTAGSVRAPIYEVRGHMNGLRTLPHSAAITSVDWHPTSSIFLTGSMDHSVRVTSMAST